MSRNSLKAVLVVSLVFNLTVVATVAVGLVVHHRPVTEHAEEMNIQDHGRHISRCIGLSEKRAKCFEAAMAGTSDEAMKIKTELDREREVLFFLLQADQTDREALKSSVERISALQGKLEILLVMGLVDSRQVLEPDEDERLLNLIRCSMKPGCAGMDKCPAQNRKEGSE
jgi:uncharacterized membrane protein